MLQSKEVKKSEVDFLLRYPVSEVESPFPFVNESGWAGVKYLSDEIDDFENLDKDIESGASRWKKIIESENPEREKLPQDWKNKTPFQRLCIMRCFRLDRMTYAIKYLFVD